MSRCSWSLAHAQEFRFQTIYNSEAAMRTFLLSTGRPSVDLPDQLKEERTARRMNLTAR